MRARACLDVRVESVQSFHPVGSNSGCQTWLQASVPPQPSRRPSLLSSGTAQAYLRFIDPVSYPTVSSAPLPSFQSPSIISCVLVTVSLPRVRLSSFSLVVCKELREVDRGQEVGDTCAPLLSSVPLTTVCWLSRGRGLLGGLHRGFLSSSCHLRPFTAASSNCLLGCVGPHPRLLPSPPIFTKLHPCPQKAE